MVYYGTVQFTMGYHGMTQFIMVYSGFVQFTMVCAFYQGIVQFTMEYYSRIYYSMLWCTLPWYGTTVYHGIVPGYTVVLLQMYFFTWAK